MIWRILTQWLDRFRFRNHPLQGLWKVDGVTLEGRRVFTDTGYIWFRGRHVREVSSMKLNGGTTEYEFTLDEAADPKRIACYLPGRGRMETIRSGIYRIVDGVLELNYGWDAGVPEQFDSPSPIGMLYRCTRDAAPAPTVKRASGTPPLHDDVLGTMHWNDELGEYNGAFELNGCEIDLTIQPLRDGGRDAAISKAKDLVGNAVALQAELLSQVSGDLLVLKNGTWLEENEQPLSASEFERRLTLQSVTVDCFGYVSWYYGADEMFTDHDVEAVIDPQGVFSRAKLSG